MECILFKYRCRLLGKVPRTREEYDPAQLLDKLTADKTLVLDSENLPDDWKSFDLRTLLDDGDLIFIKIAYFFGFLQTRSIKEITLAK